MARGGVEGASRVEAVLFDVDFTLAKPGPLLGPEGYREAGARHGLTLVPELYPQARAAAIEDLQHHPELEHDEEIWVRFTTDIVRGMGGDGPRAEEVARAITDGWLRSANFELYEDTLPVLAELREHGLSIGLVSNTSRDLDAFVRALRARRGRVDLLRRPREGEARPLHLPRHPRRGSRSSPRRL